jgi:hypothetical protein
MENILFDKEKDKEQPKEVPVETPVKPSGLPTAEDMREFSQRNGMQENWDKLCAYPKFMELLCTDIEKAKVAAEKILASKGDKI